jgi:hypothetical protein
LAFVVRIGANLIANSGCYRKIPCATEQGKFLREQGSLTAEQGIYYRNQGIAKSKILQQQGMAIAYAGLVLGLCAGALWTQSGRRRRN